MVWISPHVKWTTNRYAHMASFSTSNLHHLLSHLGTEKALKFFTMHPSSDVICLSSVNLSLIVSGKLILCPAAVLWCTVPLQQPNRQLAVQLCTAQQLNRRDQAGDAAICMMMKWGNPRCAAYVPLHAWPRRTSAEQNAWDDAHSWWLRAGLDDMAHSSWPVGGGPSNFNRCRSSKLFPSSALRSLI